MGRKVILTTIGSLGDLHPFLAIGVALRRRGFAPVMAVPEDHLAKARAAGLDAVAVMPGFDTIRESLGLSEAAVVARIMADQNFLLDTILTPWIATGARALDAIAADAAAIVASRFMFGAPMIAEKHGVPLVDVILQPMTMFSAYDPPDTADFRLLRHPPVGAIGVGWNRLVYAALRRVLRRRYAGLIDAARAGHGLRPSRNAILLDGGDPALTLCCYSPAFGPPMPDAPPLAEITGFPIFDSESGGVETVDPALAAFLDAGAPPLVFTLGSFAVHVPGGFYATAAIVARRLGMRAVLLIGDGPAPAPDDSVFFTRYAAHSTLFPRAAAIVHHGGAGTTGQALRAGKPQLVVPHMGDQNDNARRVERMGAGSVIAPSDFTLERASAVIAALLADAACRAMAETTGVTERGTDGAEQAAAAIERVVVAKAGGQ